MGIQIYQVSSTVIELAVALWLYCQKLPRRDGFASRIATAVICVAALTALSIRLGFSMFPPLTDDASFVRAVLEFAVVLGVATATVMLAWDSSFRTAFFCSTSAYLLQNLAGSLDRMLHLMNLIPQSQQVQVGASFMMPLSGIISNILTVAVMYSLVYLLFIRNLTREGLEDVDGVAAQFATLVAMLVSIVFDLAIKDLPSFDIPWRYPVVFSIVHLATCAFILVAEYEIVYNQSLRTSVATMERIVSEQERQYALSQQTIDAINRRVHNMRHHVFSILLQDRDGTLDRDKLRMIAREIHVYDSSVKTGNVALDVVLTEKGLVCQQEGIALTCMADGHTLDFMAASDIYSLFGAAVDGAIAAVQDINDKSPQAISLNVHDAMGMAAISVEHYLVSPDQRNPQREQEGEQALETMRTIVERYGGTFVLGNEADDNVFHFDALIPIP